MLVESNIPPSQTDYLENRPFSFILNGQRFSIRPFSAKMVDELNKNLFYLTLQMLYRELKPEQIANLLLIKKDDIKDSASPEELKRLTDKIKRTKSLIHLLVRMLDPVNPFRKVGLIVKHNLRYWYSLKTWRLTLKGYFEWYIPTVDDKQTTLLDLISFFHRYSSEEKKTLSQILQAGIGSITSDRKDANGTKSASTEPDWKPDSPSLGMMMLGSRAA